MARTIIADTGPLIAFAKADHLTILRQLIGTVWITESVESECDAKLGQDSDRIATAIETGWMLVKAVTGSSMPASGALGAGETDGLQLALRKPESRLLIIDDRLAGRRALAHGLKIIGTVRLLDVAEKRGLISSAEQLIERMRGEGYRIAPQLLRQIRGQ